MKPVVIPFSDALRAKPGKLFPGFAFCLFPFNNYSQGNLMGVFLFANLTFPFPLFSRDTPRYHYSEIEYAHTVLEGSSEE